MLKYPFWPLLLIQLLVSLVYLLFSCHLLPTHPASELDDKNNGNIQINANIDPAYYESAQWETHIETKLNSFAVRQPQGQECHNSSSSPQCTDSKSSYGHFYLLVSPFRNVAGYSNGKKCTFIALFMASTYIRPTNKNILELYLGSPLNSSWITLMLSSTVHGNNGYDRVTLGIGSPFFSVADVKENLLSVLGDLTLEDTINLSISITNGMTICFVGYNNKIYILDSHPHNAFGPVFGAMV